MLISIVYEVKNYFPFDKEKRKLSNLKNNQKHFENPEGHWRATPIFAKSKVTYFQIKCILFLIY